ncbi:hypothetical protein NGM99_10305 [Mesorhizobium sp. RP14(2022)]|uniref:Uncharacterized protein n=1 Tax=Mesorhizobium liriopis TaxID=2953882 RepID=A0ABT1C7P1_9HYPH|nr:hypothetical protein [Mesorhizobium liriopis]MCO6050176.1 hypothetical protein [Mesorhizobium liriopis]
MTADDTDSLHAFITELIRAANEIERVSIQERGALLRRAAITIRRFEGESGELNDRASVTDLIDGSLLPRVIRARAKSSSRAAASGTVRSIVFPQLDTGECDALF